MSKLSENRRECISYARKQKIFLKKRGNYCNFVVIVVRLLLNRSSETSPFNYIHELIWIDSKRNEKLPE